MSEEGKSSFCSKEVAGVPAYKNSKRNTSIPSTPAVSKNRLENPYRNRESYERFLNRCFLELPHSLKKKRAVVSGLAKEVGLSMQNEYDKRTYGNLNLSNEIKEEMFFSIRRFSHNAWCKR